MMTFRHFLGLVLATALLLGPLPKPWDGLSGLSGLSGAAWADDDDDDDGDDDDDDDDHRGGGGDDGLRNFLRLPRVARPARPAPPPPAFAANEIVALALTPADLAALTAQGFAVVEEAAVPGLGTTPRRLRPPPGVGLDQARASVRALPSGQDADFNHYYRPEQGFASDCRGAECPARASIGWPLFDDRALACGRGVSIGMIDTGINAGHSAFRGADLDLRRLAPEGFDPSRAVHGTAVASLLVGDPATRAPGLIPAARLVAVDAFHRAGADERADAFTLVQALGLLADSGVGVINLSLAGPPNAVLERVVDHLVLERDIVLVAAVGNDGPAAGPAYPAAYAPVIAVTAVDRQGRVYRRAVQGEHVDLAAPGVDVWAAASVSGARPKTGTSFAAPFVSAAAALIRQVRPDLTASAVRDELRRQTRDLGDPGPDPVHGAGLLDGSGMCIGT